MANVAIGYGVSLTQRMPQILPLFGIAISMADNLAIGAIYTVISIARSYCVRRHLTGGWHDNHRSPTVKARDDELMSLYPHVPT